MEKHILEQIDPKVLGTRLQEARKARGLTQQAVADDQGMARTTIVAIEKGERRVNAPELLRLAELYGRPVSEFVNRQEVTIGFVPQFRTEWREDFSRDQVLERAGEDLQKLAEDYVELERRCGLPTKRSYPPTYDTSRSSPEQAAEEIAATERNRLGIGDGPISNLRDRLETDVGMRVFYFAMSPTVSGVFAYNDLLGGCIGINAKHPRDRRTWSLAHEYGHFLTNRYRAEITFLSETRRQSSSERLADAFAENFLMPASGLNRRFTEMYRANPDGRVTIAQLCTLADLYRVSVQALVIRLEKLKRIPAGMWDRLEGEGFKPRKAQQLLGLDPNAAEQYELPRRYLNLAVMAYDQELISEGQLARLLRSDRVSSRVIVEQLSHRYFEEAGGYEDRELDLAQLVPGR